MRAPCARRVLAGRDAIADRGGRQVRQGLEPAAAPICLHARGLKLAPPSGARPASGSHGGGGAVASHANWVRATCWSPNSSVAASRQRRQIGEGLGRRPMPATRSSSTRRPSAASASPRTGPASWPAATTRRSTSGTHARRGSSGTIRPTPGRARPWPSTRSRRAVTSGVEINVNVGRPKFDFHTGYLASTGADGTVKSTTSDKASCYTRHEGHAGGAAACAFSGMSTKGSYWPRAAPTKPSWSGARSSTAADPRRPPRRRRPPEAPTPRAPIAAAAAPPSMPAPTKGVRVVAEDARPRASASSTPCPRSGPSRNASCADEGRVATILEKQMSCAAALEPQN